MASSKRTAALPWILGGALVVQFLWWNAKCPQVFSRGKGY